MIAVRSNMEAKDYYSKYGIGQLFNSLLTGLLFNRPKEPIKYLQECLSKIEESSTSAVKWDLFVDVPTTAKAPLPPIAQNGISEETVKAISREASLIESQKSPLPPIGETKRSPTPQVTKPSTATPTVDEFEKHEIVFIMGGPGLSKRVISENLASRWPGFVHISMNSVVRAHIAKMGSSEERWQMAESLVTKGEVNLDVTANAVENVDHKIYAIDLLVEKLREHSEARGFILEGFPRSVQQVEEYNEKVGKISVAVLIDAEQPTLQQALIRRGHEVKGQENVAAVAARQIAFYKSETLPVCKYLDDRGLLALVDGEQRQNEIFRDLIKLLAEKFGAPTDDSDEMKVPHPPSGPRPASSRSRTSSSQPLPAIPDVQVSNIRELTPAVPDLGRKDGLPSCPILLLMGGPGSGRSQQATSICARYPGFRHLSIQDVAKRHVVAQGQAEQTWDMMASLVQMGEVDADAVTADMVVSELNKFQDDVHAIVLEGYPRTETQLNDFNLHIGRADLVVLLDSSEFYMTLRLLERGDETGRVDDNLAAIGRRLTFFRNETLPVIRHYDNLGRLVVVQGDRDFSEVFYDLSMMIDTTFYRKAVEEQPNEVAQEAQKAQEATEDGRESVAEEIIEPTKATLLYEGEDEQSGKKTEADALKQCKVIFVTGGPGSGKGTQCEKILADFDVGHVSTGDLIRAEVETGSERAKQLKEVMEKGELVSLDVVLELLREHLTKNASHHKGFLVDGFPRELDQATRFEKEVVECTCMLYMDASEEEMKSRILERAKTSGRSDDNEETIVKRIETFKSNNDAIIKYFEEKSKLVKIDCNGTDIDAIYSNVKEALEKNGIDLKGAENANGTAAAAAESPAEGETATAEAAKEEAKEEAKSEEPAAAPEATEPAADGAAPAAEEAKE